MSHHLHGFRVPLVITIKKGKKEWKVGTRSLRTILIFLYTFFSCSLFATFIFYIFSFLLFCALSSFLIILAACLPVLLLLVCSWLSDRAPRQQCILTLKLRAEAEAARITTNKWKSWKWNNIENWKKAKQKIEK